MKAPSNSLNVIELIRVSTKAQANEDRGGIPAQRAACKVIAQRHGLTIKWSIEMTDVSGAAVMYSPEIRRLTEILKAGDCCGVVMKEHTRLMRPDNFEDYALLQVFKDHAVKIYAPDDVMDLSTASGQLMGMFKFGMAGYERATILQRCSDARTALKKAGKCPSPAHTLPYGLTYDRKKELYGWDETKAAQVLRLFELFVEGEAAFSELSRETGIGYHNVRDVLSNPVYTGVRVYDERRAATGKFRDGHEITKKVKVSAEQVIKVSLPCGGIVTEDVFARAQKILALKSEMKWRARRSPDTDPFLFRGLLKCGCCDHGLITFTHRVSAGATEREYYICRAAHGDRGKWNAEKESYEWRIKNRTCRTARIRRDRLEPVLNDLIAHKLSNPDFVLKALEAYRHSVEQSDNKGQIARLTKEIGAASDKVARLKTLFVDGDISRFEYEQRKKKIDEQTAGAQQALAKLTPDVPRVSPEALVRIFAGFSDWQYLDTADRRALLRSVVPVIKVSGIGNGKKGAGANTEIKINGFYLSITGDDVMPEDGCGGLAVIRKRGGVRREARANSGSTQLVPNLVRSSKDQNKHQLVYIPLSA
jgi:site-specific DNA recombinase